MDKFTENFIQVCEFGKKKYVIFQYSDETWGVMTREKYEVVHVPRRFISSKKAKECARDILSVDKYKQELKEQDIEQLDLFA